MFMIVHVQYTHSVIGGVALQYCSLVLQNTESADKDLFSNYIICVQVRVSIEYTCIANKYVANSKSRCFHSALNKFQWKLLWKAFLPLLRADTVPKMPRHRRCFISWYCRISSNWSRIISLNRCSTICIILTRQFREPSLPLSFLCSFSSEIISDAQDSNKSHQETNKANRLI